MKLEQILSDIDWTIVEELTHIPRGPQGTPQEELRQEYSAFRSLHHHMNADLGPTDALEQAICAVQRRHSRFSPRYDQHFFGTV